MTIDCSTCKHCIKVSYEFVNQTCWKDVCGVRQIYERPLPFHGADYNGKGYMNCYLVRNCKDWEGK